MKHSSYLPIPLIVPFFPRCLLQTPFFPLFHDLMIPWEGVFEIFIYYANTTFHQRPTSFFHAFIKLATYFYYCFFLADASGTLFRYSLRKGSTYFSRFSVQTARISLLTNFSRFDRWTERISTAGLARISFGFEFDSRAVCALTSLW